MIQTRICSHYNAACSHCNATPTTFFSLPEDLRDRIYRYAGVVNGTSFRIFGSDLPQSVKDRIPQFTRWFQVDAYCTRERHGRPFFLACERDHVQPETSSTYLNLNISNSLVSADVARFLYTHNEILLCCEDYSDLNILLCLPFTWLCSLRRLTIHLSPPGGPVRFASICGHRGFDPDARPLKSTSKAFSTLMQTWSRVANRLAYSATCDIPTLDLAIICDEDEVTAQCLVQIQKAHGLATASLRLKDESDAELAEIARSVVLRGSEITDPPFRFLDLPVELRQHILSYTNLVSPLGQVTWYESGEFGKFYNSLDRAKPVWWLTCGEFCARQYAVYPHCSCLIPPTSLFLVCKEMLADARAIFFTANRFIISIDFRQRSWMRTGISGEESNFLGKMVPREALSYLRSLEIRFPSTPYQFSEIDEEEFRHWTDDELALYKANNDANAYNLWIKSIEYLSPRLKRLSLRLYMMHNDLPSSKHPLYFDDIQKRVQALFRVQEEIVRPLGQLQSLDNCFVQAMHHFQTTGWSSDPTFSEQLRAHERHLESLAMGSNYDSIANGKLEQRQSEWLKLFEDTV